MKRSSWEAYYTKRRHGNGIFRSSLIHSTEAAPANAGIQVKLRMHCQQCPAEEKDLQRGLHLPRTPTSRLLPDGIPDALIADMGRNSNIGKVGIVIWFVFCTPFALFGLYALSQALRLAVAGPGAPPFWYPLIFGVVFSAIGFGLMFLAIFGKKKYAKQQQLEAEHANEPWLWRPDWAQGHVKSQTRRDMAVGWFATVVCNLASLPFYWALLHGRMPHNQPIAYVFLAFPAVGLWLLYRSLKATAAFYKYGANYFDMASVPAVIGRELKGSIETSFRHTPDHGLHLRLSSVHKETTGSGKSQTTSESILWRDQQDLDPGQLSPGPRGTTIPVFFEIPLDLHPTEKISPRDEYVWLLEAMADMPGVNYHDAFELPVFRTAATPTPQEEPTIERSEFAVPAARPPEHLTVRISDSGDGREFYFPAARNPGVAVSFSIFAIIFSAITVLLSRSQAPIIFALAFGFFTCLLIYFSLRQWMRTTRVIVGSTLKVQSGMLGGGSVREIAFSAIASIDDKITTQQGQATGTPYYDIVLQMRDGSSVTLGTMLPSKRETEWLISEFSTLTGLKAQAVGAGAAP